jgi:hypothetical protein
VCAKLPVRGFTPWNVTSQTKGGAAMSLLDDVMSSTGLER